MDRHRRRAAATAGRGREELDAQKRGAARRRDSGGGAQPRRGQGKTHRAYVWVYRSAQAPLVVYDYRGSRGGEHARAFLQGWSGTLVVDDFSGYKALFAGGAIREAACWAHARREFFEAH